MSGFVQPKAGWKVTLDGRDLTAIMDPLLVSLTLSEKRSEACDQLDIVLRDTDGQVELPPEGAVLRVALGWVRGSGRMLGLVDKGSFNVDEVGFDGAPDVITIRARSADFTDAFRVRRQRSFIGKTVKAIIDEIAGANGLSSAVEATLGAKTIPALGHGAKSDAALLAALGKRFDAVATVKANTLIFAPVGSGKTASGKTLPTIEIARSETTAMRGISYTRASREQYGGVEARWHDKAQAKRETVAVGGSGGGKPKRLRKVYASEADARQAAEAENSKQARKLATARVQLAFGRPDITPEMPSKLNGFKAEISAQKWIIEAVEHNMDGRGGLISELELEVLQTN